MTDKRNERKWREGVKTGQCLSPGRVLRGQGCDRYKYFGSPNQIQNQIRLVLLVLTNTKIRYHYGKMSNFVSPNQLQIQIELVLLVQPDTRDDTSQPCLWLGEQLESQIPNICKPLLDYRGGRKEVARRSVTANAERIVINRRGGWLRNDPW